MARMDVVEKSEGHRHVRQDRRFPGTREVRSVDREADDWAEENKVERDGNEDRSDEQDAQNIGRPTGQGGTKGERMDEENEVRQRT